MLYLITLYPFYENDQIAAIALALFCILFFDWPHYLEDFLRRVWRLLYSYTMNKTIAKYSLKIDN